MNTPDFVIGLVRGGCVLKRRVGNDWPLLEWHDTRNDAEARIATIAQPDAVTVVRWLNVENDWAEVVL